jgi:hypothetical protein
MACQAANNFIGGEGSGEWEFTNRALKVSLSGRHLRVNDFLELHSSLHVFDLGPENEAGDPVGPYVSKKPLKTASGRDCEGFVTALSERPITLHYWVIQRSLTTSRARLPSLMPLKNE